MRGAAQPPRASHSSSDDGDPPQPDGSTRSRTARSDGHPPAGPYAAAVIASAATAPRAMTVRDANDARVSAVASTDATAHATGVDCQAAATSVIVRAS